MLEDGSIRIYSRNQEDNTSKYPDIIQRFANCIDGDVKTCILDAEAVAWDREKKQIQPFQVKLAPEIRIITTILDECPVVVGLEMERAKARPAGRADCFGP